MFELREKRKVIDIPENKIFGYPEKFHYTGLYKNDWPTTNGKMWFLATVGNVERELKEKGVFSCTWITDEQAQEFIANAIIDEIIQSDDWKKGQGK
jgi:hypothetical protein